MTPLKLVHYLHYKGNIDFDHLVLIVDITVPSILQLCLLFRAGFLFLELTTKFVQVLDRFTKVVTFSGYVFLSPVSFLSLKVPESLTTLTVIFVRFKPL